ncbi:MAG: HemK2/MTQ2 family protein methyltransferase [archaeon]
MTIYEPSEDSYLLEKHIRTYRPVSKSLDMGTGSGIQAKALSKISGSVIAVDINPRSIKNAKQECRGLKNIKFLVSDLFKSVPKVAFDLIVFNPPYLPEEKNIADIALFSKKQGSKTIVEFTSKVNDYLADEGSVFIIISSLTKQKPVFDCISENLLEVKEIEKVHRFFEDIILLKIWKSDLQKKLSNLKITDAKLFAKGKRGVIIRGKHRAIDIAVKIKKSTSTAPGTIENEARFLEILNKSNIGPTLIMWNEKMLIYRFVEGIFINEFILTNQKNDILEVIGKIIEQLSVMDSLGINKFEMHHPVKHILIKNNQPTLIDFERCRYTENPKNITQFCDFLCSSKKILSAKGIDVDDELIRKLAQQYKQTKDGSKIELILKSLQ